MYRSGTCAGQGQRGVRHLGRQGGDGAGHPTGDDHFLTSIAETYGTPAWSGSSEGEYFDYKGKNS